ncbi:hypothetical protein D3C80_1920390 [compost metagenome]
MLHNTSSICARRVGYPNTQLGCRFVIDVVVARAVPGNDPQLRGGGDHLCRDMASAQKYGIYLLLNVCVRDRVGAIAKSNLTYQ